MGLLTLALLVICMTVAYGHLNYSLHEVEPLSFYAFGAREPFVYRILIPATVSLLPLHAISCTTHLGFPLEHCSDLAALGVDWLALVLSCLILVRAYRIIAAHDPRQLHAPVLVAPLFLWMVIFDYVIVITNSIYYPFDFLSLLFFSSAVWAGVSGRAGVWCLPLLTFISALNKEDALFLPLTAAIYAFWLGRLHRGMLLSVVAALIAVFIAKYASLLYVRQVLALPVPSPTLYENHLGYNLHQLLNPVAWLAWLSVFGGGAFVLALSQPRIARLKVIVVAIILAYLPVVFMVGESREIRLFGPLICAVLLPVMLTLDALVFGATDAAAAAATTTATAGGGAGARPRALAGLTPMRLGAALVGVAVAGVVVWVLLKRAAAAHGAGEQPLAALGHYQDLLSCEGSQIHSCRSGDGRNYDCLFTNQSQTRIEISDVKIWNYDADNRLINQHNADTLYELPPGRTVFFQFRNLDPDAVHGKLCRRDPQSSAIEHWFDAG